MRIASLQGDFLTIECIFCGSTSWSARVGNLRDAPSVGVRECDGCGVVVPDKEPAVTVDYASGTMFPGGTPDFEQLRLSFLGDSVRRTRMLGAGAKGRSILDIGCGAGGFLSTVKNGVRNYGIEVDEAARDFSLSTGLSVFAHIDEMASKDLDQVRIVTLFHVLEHIPEPFEFLTSLLGELPNAELLVVEVPCSEDPLLTVLENEAATRYLYWSHHCHLHSARSLRLLLDRVHPNAEVLRVQRYGLANHLGWLHDGRPGGDGRYSWASSEDLNNAYRASITAIGLSDTLWATLPLSQ
jgi:hypothetical protein